MVAYPLQQLTVNNTFQQWMTRLNDVIVSLGFDSNAHITPGAINITINDATTSVKGIAKIADSNAAVVGNADDTIITPNKLKVWAANKAASTSARGLIQIADSNTAVAQIDDLKAITAQKLRSVILSYFTSNADAATGTTTTKLITPANLKFAIDNRLADSNTAAAGTDEVKLMTPAKTKVAIQNISPTVPDASQTVKGKVELLTDAEAQTGTDTVRAMTAANLQAVTATASRKGVVELATDVEAQTGTDTVRVITAANLQAVTATVTRKGVAALTDSNGVIVGTSPDTIVTPELLKKFWAVKTAGIVASKGFLGLDPFGNIPPATNYAVLGFRNGHPYLAFNDTTQQSATWIGVLPDSYAGNGLTVTAHWAAASAITGTIGWTVEIERIGTVLDIDADSFAAAQTITAATVSGTSGILSKTSVNISNGANMDSLAAGEYFRIRISRNVASDTAVGNAELYAVYIREQ